MLIGFDGSRAFTSQNTGTENYSLNLLNSLARIDSKNNYRVYLRELNGEKLDLVQLAKYYPKNFEFRIIRPNRFWTQYGLALETWKAPVDVLFVPAHTLPLLQNYRVKNVVTIHDLGVEYLPNFHKFPQRYYLDVASRFAAKKANRIIAVSGATKKDLEKRYGIIKSKIDIVHEGVNRDFFKRQNDKEIARVKRQYNLKDDYILYVGTVQPRKNLMFLIDIFNAYVKNNSVKFNGSKDNNRYPRKDQISLVIAGKFGWMYEDILSYPASLGIKSRVKFLNYVKSEDLPGLYSGAKAFVYPSLFEGFGLPILEALSTKCPVIASDIPVHKEIFKTITRGYFDSKAVFGDKTTGYNKGQAFSSSIFSALSGKKFAFPSLNNGQSGKNKIVVPMVLAKLEEPAQWVDYLYHIIMLKDLNRSNVFKPFIDDKYWDWDRVAMQTIKVFNRVNTPNL